MNESRTRNTGADQYRNSANLRTRGNLHARYANRDWFGWVSGHLDLRPDSDLIDIGCGPGVFWSAAAGRVPQDVRLTLVDRSQGMVAEAVRSLSANGVFGAVVGQAADAAALPYPDRSFDRAIAMHMLYHVDDCERALDEIVRLLRPEGMAIVTTNGDDNLVELFDLDRRAFGGAGADPAAQAFGIARAQSLLASRFDTVAVHRFEDTYAIDDVEEVFGYLTSFPPGSTASEAEQARLKRLISDTLRENDGVLKATRAAGVICARGPRQSRNERGSATSSPPCTP